MPPRRRAALAVFAALAVLTLGAAVAVPLQADAAWRAMQAEAATLRGELAAQPPQRAVLWGEPGPGNAHAHYAAAAALARALARDHQRDLVALLPHGQDLDGSRHAALRSRWRELLVPLRAGAAAADASWPAPGDGDLEAPIANLLDWRWLANAAVFEARARLHEGRDLEAVQPTLDAAMLAADLLRRGRLVEQTMGLALLAIGTTEAWPERALARLERGALDLLATGLARLDASLPTTLDDRIELLHLAACIAQAPTEAEWLPAGVSTWRFGFSARWLLADAFLRQAGRSRRLQANGDAPWPARLATLDREGAAASGNPVAATLLPSLVAAEGTWRLQLARLRLLRLAVDLHRGVEPPAVVDPIGGGPIAITSGPDGVRLACAPLGGGEPPTRLVVR
ncbi:MAG: hypothetical protein KF830_18075 [Planctomycetes bacterium]|nr:hypothetical protein [Planctomycetota bacterium]